MTTSPTAELAAAAQALRPSSPAVAAHTVAVRIPVAAAEALADWLGCLSMLDPSERGGDECGWCGSSHAATVARALLARTHAADHLEAADCVLDALTLKETR